MVLDNAWLWQSYMVGQRSDAGNAWLRSIYNALIKMGVFALPYPTVPRSVFHPVWVSQVRVFTGEEKVRRPCANAVPFLYLHVDTI